LPSKGHPEWVYIGPKMILVQPKIQQSNQIASEREENLNPIQTKNKTRKRNCQNPMLVD